MIVETISVWYETIKQTWQLYGWAWNCSYV